MPGMLKNFGPYICEPQIACLTLQKANSKLVFKLRNTATYSRKRHVEATRCLRKAAGLHDLGKNFERIEICHHYPKYGNVISSVPI